MIIKVVQNLPLTAFTAPLKYRYLNQKNTRLYYEMVWWYGVVWKAPKKKSCSFNLVYATVMTFIYFCFHGLNISLTPD